MAERERASYQRTRSTARAPLAPASSALPSTSSGQSSTSSSRVTPSVAVSSSQTTPSASALVSVGLGRAWDTADSTSGVSVRAHCMCSLKKLGMEEAASGRALSPLPVSMKSLCEELPGRWPSTAPSPPLAWCIWASAISLSSSKLMSSMSPLPSSFLYLRKREENTPARAAALEGLGELELAGEAPSAAGGMWSSTTCSVS
mmetsp:Transcript_26458/g.68469  ORF Transcript_26458/g.68469 Transcript_26458/m.68469 type:complete len:202 (+) Transcript_26458:250-855(+)